MQTPMTQYIIWRIGFRKTGTTSVQYLLTHFPKQTHPDLFISSRDSLAHDWRSQIVRATREGKRPDPARLAAEMAKVAAVLRGMPQQTFIISDENLFAFSLFDRDGSHFFDWAAQVLPIVESTFADFDNVFVAYVRPMENWLKSSYSQEVKRGRTWLDFDSWRKKVPSQCNWVDGIAAIRNAIRSPLHLIPHDEDSTLNLPLGARLLEMGGVPRDAVAQLGSAPRLNESLSPAMLRLLRLFNFLGLNGLIRMSINRRARTRELSRHKEQP